MHRLVFSTHMGQMLGVIYIETVPDESRGSATWVRGVLGLTLSLLHKSRGTWGLAAKSVYHYFTVSLLSVGSSTDLNNSTHWQSVGVSSGDYRVSSHEVEPGLQWVPQVPSHY